MSSKGVFITIEGPDGAGKTTQAQLLAEHLSSLGYDVVRAREPGGTPIGMHIRDIILDLKASAMSPMAEFLLYAADRAQDVNEVILPALKAGRVVIGERFTDSSIAYQGYGLGLSIEDIRTVNRIATGGLVPDLTILLDIDPRIGVGRAASSRQADRIELRRAEFHEAVRHAYLRQAESEPDRFRVIAATARSVQEIHCEVVSVVLPVIAQRGVANGGS